MSYDELLRAALDDAAARVRGSLEATLRAFGEELRRRAAAERDDVERRAAEAAVADRQQAEAQLAALQHEADQRIAAAHQETQQRLEDARRAFETELAGARSTAEAEAAEIRQKADAAIAETRQQAAAEAAELRARTQADIEDARRTAQAEVSDLQRALDERSAASRREIEEVRRETEEARRLTESSRTASEEMRRQLDAVRVEADQLRARLGDEHQDLALLHGIRSIDEARTLGDVLDRVVQVRRRDRERVAVFVMKGGRLQQWRAAGFTEGEPPDTLDAAQAEGGILADVVRRGVPAVRTAAQTGAVVDGSHSRDAAAFPITIGGAVVAVLYGDAPGGQGAEDARWRAAFEVLSRHASRVLEAITIQRAAGLLPPAGSVSRAAASGGGVQ